MIMLEMKNFAKFHWPINVRKKPKALFHEDKIQP